MNIRPPAAETPLGTLRAVARPDDRPAGPRLPEALIRPAEALRLEDDLALVGLELAGDVSGQGGQRVSLEECRLAGLRCTGAHLAGLHLTDVEVVGADFSGADLEEAAFNRVTFVDCRLSGVLLPGAVLRDVVFIGCRMDDANLRVLRTQRVRFEEVDLHDSELNGATLTSTCFFDCDLTRIEVTNATLGGARLHGSTLLDVRGAAFLRDAVIDSAQLVAVAYSVLGSAGIRIEDEREPL